MHIKNRIKIIFFPTLMIATLIHADEFPVIKEGQWHSEISSVNSKSKEILKQCFGSTQTVKDLFESSKKNLQGVCSQFESSKSGSTFTSKVTCDLGISKIVSTSEASGDFETTYTVKTKTTMTPALGGMNGETSTITAKYMGPCESGMNPGDMITGDGQKLNMNEMASKMNNNTEALKNMGKNMDMNAIQEMQKKMQQMMQK